MYQAFVLAAGFGTRLRPVTEHTPKPLVTVCGVPLLAYTLALCARHGLREVLVNAHHLADQLEAWEGTREGVNVTVSTEPEILGTAGSLRAARDRMEPRFAVLNGDVLSDVDLARLVDAVRPGEAVLALRSAPGEIAQLGVVAADETRAVVAIKDFARAQPRGRVDRSTHFTGIHAMHRAVLDRVPEQFGCIMRTAYQQMVPEHRLQSLRHEGLWMEITDVATLLHANLRALRGELALPLDPLPRAAWARSGGRETGDPAAVRGVRVEGAAWVGPGARVEPGARLGDSVVGEGAAVARGAVVERCVVWPGVAVPAGHYADAVIHPGGVTHCPWPAEAAA